MATLNLGSFETGSVPVAEIVDALAIEWDYQENVSDPQNPGATIPNPQTKAQFLRENLRRILTEAYRNGKRRLLLAEAENNVPTIDLT